MVLYYSSDLIEIRVFNVLTICIQGKPSNAVLCGPYLRQLRMDTHFYKLHTKYRSHDTISCARDSMSCERDTYANEILCRAEKKIVCNL